MRIEENPVYLSVLIELSMAKAPPSPSHGCVQGALRRATKATNPSPSDAGQDGKRGGKGALDPHSSINIDLD